MTRRQLVLLAALSISAVIELSLLRILLPVLRRRVGVFPGMGVAEGIQPVFALAMVVGAAALLVWVLGWPSPEVGTLTKRRKAAAVLILLVGAMELVRVAGVEQDWVEAARHVMAMFAIVFIATDVFVNGTTLARAGAGIGSLALFSSTLFLAVILFHPTSITARWLATFAESMSILMPWVLSVVVTRRYMEDLVAVAGSALAVVVSVTLAVTVAPAIYPMFAQATGFRYAIHPIANVLTVGASFYFVIRCFRSEELPRQVPWAYIWLAASGIQMVEPHLQMGGLTALAALAWAPPLSLPTQTRRWRFEKPDPCPVCEAAASAVESPSHEDESQG